MGVSRLVNETYVLVDSLNGIGCLLSLDSFLVELREDER